MELITGKLTNSWLESHLAKAELKCEGVRAAVAYADASPKLIDSCFKNNIPLEFWGRYDSSVPVPTALLQRFLDKKSLNHICKLIPEIFHPKVIWWEKYGAYIGSANLTSNGWLRNIECGVFISDSELTTQGLDQELEEFFTRLDSFAHRVTQELVDQIHEAELKNREIRKLQALLQIEFDKTRIIPRIDSLISDSSLVQDKARNNFISEWFSTLTILRTIASRISQDEFRPVWIDSSVPGGVQADQFLQAYYYKNVFDGQQTKFRDFFERHKADPDAAFMKAAAWWKTYSKPSLQEEEATYEWAPFLKEKLTKESLLVLTQPQFRDVCSRIHSMRVHSLQVDNGTYGLPKAYGTKTIDECLDLLSKYLWNQRSQGGKTVAEVIFYVLYGGRDQEIGARLWEATRSQQWHIPHLGLSALGEMIGWAMPDRYQPRNDRTNKALYALGHPVAVRTG